MSTSHSDLLQTLENDQSNLETILQQFRQNGILPYFERMLDLISRLSAEVQSHVSASLTPFIRSSGRIAIPWELKLKMHMIHSAWNQFTFAISHLLRAQASESYGHVRRAIEGAGVSYLSNSEPDLAELYGKGDEKKFRNRTGTNKLLPPQDPLTADLNRMVREASSRVHSNFRSLDKMLEEEILDEGKRARYTFKAHFYEADSSLKHFWHVSYFILEAGYRVMLLLADSSDLPKGDWYARVDNFKIDLEKHNTLLMNAIQKNEA